MPPDLYEYETTPDGGGGPAPVVEAPAPEPAAPEPASGDPGDEQPDPGGASQPQPEPEFDEAAFRAAVAEEAEAVVQAQLARFQQQNGYQPYQPPIAGATPGPLSGFPPLPEYDPYDPESANAYFEARDQRLLAAIEQRFAPVAQTLQQQQEQALIQNGEQLAQDIIADVVTRKGDVTDAGKQMIRSLAESFMPAAVGRYGESHRAAEMAIEQAYDAVASMEKDAAERALAKHTNHVATLAGAPTQPGASGVAATVPGTPQKYMSNEELVRRWVAPVRADSKAA
jgi:hypothetical protein